jgi:hypothetical protein
MNIDNSIKVFSELGRFLKQFSINGNKENNNKLNDLFYSDFEELVKTIHVRNPWFVETNVRKAIGAIADTLAEENLVEWISVYIKRIKQNKSCKKVAVIMAGNVPLVGFHDMLCVLISGNKFIGKLSSKDDIILIYISKILIAIEPDLVDYIEFTEGRLTEFDAIISTGSNNTSRYLEYYFAKYPQIIRKNRNSVAVLTGLETTEELKLLGEDIFQYFGLGCRNVSKLFVPQDFNFNAFYEAIFDHNNIINHNKYANNYDYNRTIYLMKNENSLLDNNFLLLKEDKSYSSPIGVLFYEKYKEIKQLNERLLMDKDLLQCIVSNSNEINNSIPFGTAQCPALNDYADGVDVMEFMLNLL